MNCHYGKKQKIPFVVKRLVSSWAISQEMGMFTPRLVSAHLERQCLQQRNLSVRRLLLRLPLAIQYKMSSGAPKHKARYRNGTISSFQTCLLSAWSILMAGSMFGGSEETARGLLAFNIHIGALYLVCGFPLNWVHDTDISSSHQVI